MHDILKKKYILSFVRRRKKKSDHNVKVERQKFWLLKIHEGWRICNETLLRMQLLQSYIVSSEGLSFQHIGTIH